MERSNWSTDLTANRESGQMAYTETLNHGMVKKKKKNSIPSTITIRHVFWSFSTGMTTQAF